MKNVLTINMPFTMTWAVPYGPAVVNGILNHEGYNVTAWDLSIDIQRHFANSEEFNLVYKSLTIGGYSHTKFSRKVAKQFLHFITKEIKCKLNDINPDVILLSVFSSQSLDSVVPILTLLREFSPSAYIIAGGRGLDNIEKTTKLNYAEYYTKYLPLDCAYVGDAESELVHVLKERIKGCYYSKPATADNLTSVPPAVWNGINFSLYDGFETGDLRMPITASKGCVRECTFCDVAGSWPKYVYRKGADVGHEIIDLYHSTGIRKIEFTDNLVNGSISNFRAMNKVIAEKLPNTIDYLGYAICRPKNEFPESDFYLAKTAGASLFKVGIESGSERIRHDIKKKFSNEDINWFAENCAKYNIKQLWLMFTGYPTETEEDFQETLNLLKEYTTLAKQGLIKIHLSLPMMLTSNSGFMRNYAKEYGLEHNSNDSWSDFFWTSNVYPENTFEVRANRWRRFMAAIEKYGYMNESLRQAEKFVELNGLEKIYQDYKDAKRKNVIPIINNSINFNKESHL